MYHAAEEELFAKSVVALYRIKMHAINSLSRVSRHFRLLFGRRFDSHKRPPNLSILSGRLREVRLRSQNRA